MQRRVAGVEIVLGPVPGGEIDVDRAGGEQDQAMPENFGKLLPPALAVAISSSVRSNSRPEPSLVSSKPSIALRTGPLSSVLSCGRLRRVLGREGDIIEVRTAGPSPRMRPRAGGGHAPARSGAFLVRSERAVISAPAQASHEHRPASR